MMFMPYRMETAQPRIPYANSVFVAVISLIFFFIVFGVIPVEQAESFVLQDWDIGQMIGNTFLHGGFFHLLGNMIFLWVFGNAVCGTVGNIAYPFLYLFLGLAGSAAHLGFDGRPALGASGAVNGIVGMSLILFPANRLKCWYAYSFPMMGIFWKSGTFQTRSYWMIAAWFIFDILGIVLGGDNTAHWAHIGGFVTGVAAASLLVLFKGTETYDPTLFDIASGKPMERTSYSLEDLVVMPGLPGVSNVVNVGNARPVKSPPPPQTMPNPDFRVTNMIQKGNDLLIFFTNDGDALRDVSIVAGDGHPAFAQPGRGIARREMGTMRVRNVSPETLQGVDLTISFACGAKKVTKPLRYEKGKNRMMV